MDLLLISDETKSHYVYIKNFNRFLFHKAEHKNKNHFWKNCLQCFSRKIVLTEHIEICLRINGIQTEIENYSRQIPAPFRITADFECILHSVASTNKKKKIKITFLAVFVINWFVLIINLASQLFFIELKMLLNLSKQFLKSIITVESNEKPF